MTTPDDIAATAERSAARVRAQGTAPCGDRITTWHGRLGPCVLVGKHELHDDGHGVVWSWTETGTP